ncbi:hypothetical protein MCOR30_009297 [Pyricularia oryzae]|nr:hypothetical protein MCOR30_009297 [Pyricularia oryzae]
MMVSKLALLTAAGALLSGVCGVSGQFNGDDQDMIVPACPHWSMVLWQNPVPKDDNTTFPRTHTTMCYDKTSIHLNFTALDEKNFHFNASQGNNDPIWQYSVMEAFIALGEDDPATYLEFEVNPNNVTFQAIIYNPSKVRDEPMDTAFLGIPFPTATEIDKKTEYWNSYTRIPLGLFNLDSKTVKGTKWRMNFFRTVTSNATFPEQLLGAWKPTPKANFHMTPYFGRVMLD